MPRPAAVRLGLLALLALAACQRTLPKPPREFAATTAFGYLEAQMKFGPRIPGTAGHEAEAKWLDSLLRARADTLIVQRWTHVTAKGDSLVLTNFIARFNPQATERLLYFAHWDTRPHADSPLSTDSSAAVPGANDGASGVALLLGIADALKKSKPGVGVDLLFTDGEDYGDFQASPPNDVLIGARYYAAHQPPGPQPLYAVLWDMVADKEPQFYHEANSLTGAPEVVERVWDMAKELGYAGTFVAAPKHYLTDDHVELQKVGIRAIDVVDFDYPPWHTKNDTLDKVSAQTLQIVGDVAMGLIRRAAP